MALLNTVSTAFTWNSDIYSLRGIREYNYIFRKNKAEWNFTEENRTSIALENATDAYLSSNYDLINLDNPLWEVNTVFLWPKVSIMIMQ